jgi:hypothetical protein
VSVKLFDLASVAVARQSDEIGDPTATRTVYIVTIVLVLIGVALVALAVWLFRATRPDPQLLAPLEQMERRGWRRLGPQDRRRALDEVRPPGAAPIELAPRQPDVFEEFGHVRAVTGFADLTDAAHTARRVPSDPLVIDTVLADPELLAPPTPNQAAESIGPVPPMPPMHREEHVDDAAAREAPVEAVESVESVEAVEAVELVEASEAAEMAEAVESEPTPPALANEWAPLDLAMPPDADDVAHRAREDRALDDHVDQEPDRDELDRDELERGGEPLMPGEGLLRRRPDAR